MCTLHYRVPYKALAVVESVGYGLDGNRSSQRQRVRPVRLPPTRAPRRSAPARCASPEECLDSREGQHTELLTSTRVERLPHRMRACERRLFLRGALRLLLLLLSTRRLLLARPRLELVLLGPRRQLGGTRGTRGTRGGRGTRGRRGRRGGRGGARGGVPWKVASERFCSATRALSEAPVWEARIARPRWSWRLPHPSAAPPPGRPR